MFMSNPTLLVVICLVALIWALINAIAISSIKVSTRKDSGFGSYEMFDGNDDTLNYEDKIRTLVSIGKKIRDGANAFLKAEYSIMVIFIIVFGSIVYLIVDTLGDDADSGFSFYATFAYVLGSVTSMFCGYIGMRIAVASNYRTAYEAM